MEVNPGSMPTSLGTFPADWACCDIGSLNPFITSGSRGWAKRYAEIGAAFIRITNMSRESIDLDLSDLRRVRVPPADAEATRTQLRVGDVLISITADIGIIGWVGENVPSPAYINQHVSLIRFSRPRVDSRFVAYFLAAEASQRAFLAQTDQGAKAGLNLEQVRRVRVVLPSEVEQTAIASALSDVDALLIQFDKLIVKKRDLKQAAMQQLLCGRTRLPGFQDAWRGATIGDVADVKTGPFGSSLHESDYVEAGTPIITVEHLGERSITRQNLPLVSDKDCRRLRAYSLVAGDVVFSRVGSVDRNALVTEAESGWLFSGRLLRVRIERGRADPAFLSHQFHSEPFKLRVREVAVGQTMPSLNTQILRRLPVALPSLAEQRAIAQVLSDMDAELAALEARRDKTRQLKQGMMQELLTGRTRLT